MANVWENSYYDRVTVPKAKAHYVTRTKKSKKYLKFLTVLQTILIVATTGVILLIALM